MPSSTGCDVDDARELAASRGGRLDRRDGPQRRTGYPQRLCATTSAYSKSRAGRNVSADPPGRYGDKVPPPSGAPPRRSGNRRRFPRAASRHGSRPQNGKRSRNKNGFPSMMPATANIPCRRALAAGSRTLPSDPSRARTPSTLDVRHLLLFLDAFSTNRFRMGDSPPVGQQVQQVRAIQRQVRRVTLRRVSQFREHICQIVVHDQVVPLSAAHHTHQLKTTGAARGCPRNFQLLRPTVSPRIVLSVWLLSIGRRPSERYFCRPTHWFRR